MTSWIWGGGSGKDLETLCREVTLYEGMSETDRCLGKFDQRMEEAEREAELEAFRERMLAQHPGEDELSIRLRVAIEALFIDLKKKEKEVFAPLERGALPPKVYEYGAAAFGVLVRWAPVAGTIGAVACAAVGRWQQWIEAPAREMGAKHVQDIRTMAALNLNAMATERVIGEFREKVVLLSAEIHNIALEKSRLEETNAELRRQQAERQVSMEVLDRQTQEKKREVEELTVLKQRYERLIRTLETKVQNLGV